MNQSVERVRDALADLIKAALVSDDRKSLDFRRAGQTKLAALAEAPPDPETLRLIAEQGQVNLTLPRACPFTLEEILAPGFDVDLAAERIRKSASTG